MKTRLKALVLPLLVVMAGVALVIHKRMQLAKEPAPMSVPVVISLHELRLAPVTVTASTVADVLAVREAVVTSRLTAYVTDLPLFEGDTFKRGTVLARLSMSGSGEWRPQAGSLVAERSAAESAFQAEKDHLQRARKLYETGGVSLEQLQSAQASEAAVRSRLTAAGENLRNALPVAPFDGIIGQRLVEPGDLVTPGKPLLKIVDTSAGVRLVMNMPDDVVPSALLIRGKSLPVKAWPEASPQGSLRYEARSPATGLTPGSRVPVKAVLFSGQGLLIPRDCTLDSDGRQATILRVSGKKTTALKLEILGEGEEGVVTRDEKAAGTIACASPDILARVAAGAPFATGE